LVFADGLALVVDSLEAFAEIEHDRQVATIIAAQSALLIQRCFGQARSLELIGKPPHRVCGCTGNVLKRENLRY
jgi:hypothetical protein